MIRPHRFAALAVALVASAPLAAQQPAFTLEQALAAPFPDNLVAAATGGAVAWVFNANGARNIFEHAFCKHRTKRNNMADFIVSIRIAYIVDNFITSLDAKIDINIRHRDAFRI